MDGKAVGSRVGATRPRTGGYWQRRKDSIYYQVVRELGTGLAAEATAVLDVGSNLTPCLEWFPQAKHRTSVDLRHPYSGEGIEAVVADFLAWEAPRHYDLALCLQVIEHVPDARAFCRKLLTVANVLIVSVPYKWPAGRTKGHLHDPVDETKMRAWFGRDANYSYVCREVKTHNARLIQVYDRSGRPWQSLQERTVMLNSPDSGEAPQRGLVRRLRSAGEALQQIVLDRLFRK